MTLLEPYRLSNESGYPNQTHVALVKISNQLRQMSELLATLVNHQVDKTNLSLLPSDSAFAEAYHGKPLAGPDQEQHWKVHWIETIIVKLNELWVEDFAGDTGIEGFPLEIELRRLLLGFPANSPEKSEGSEKSTFLTSKVCPTCLCHRCQCREVSTGTALEMLQAKMPKIDFDGVKVHFPSPDFDGLIIDGSRCSSSRISALASLATGYGPIRWEELLGLDSVKDSP